MGVRMEGGGAGAGRRGWSPEFEYRAIPRYGPASPFKGHLSTKSNAFCIDSSSRRLSNQYLIRDHMAVHYNKILSAKAAVDCSVPKSRVNSIKFSDQQRREKLKKEVEKCEKEMISSRNGSRTSSRESRRPMSAFYRKDSLEAEVNRALPSYAPSEEKCFVRCLSFPEKYRIVPPSTGKSARRTAQKASNASLLSSSTSTSSLQRLHSKMSWSSSSDSITNKHSQKMHNAESKASSKDLLEAHSEYFTNGQQPFTPRTLKSDAKSFLSQYRYYMPARSKLLDVFNQQVEAETQTDISSFHIELEASEDDVGNFKKIIKEVEDIEPEKVSTVSSPRVTSPGSAQRQAIRKIQAEEEELMYLSFIQDITDEILRLGLFSNRALEMLFERHIEQNKRHLNETKMRHLLEILKIDLGCNKKEPSSRRSNKYGLLENKAAKRLQLPNEAQGESELAKNEELLKAMDILARESPACSEHFRGLETQDENATEVHEPVHVESDLSSIAVTDGKLETSCMLTPTCSSTTCNADFEISDSLREVDNLRESLDESFPISTDNPLH
uniref:Spermatosis associated 7 n=1 Tax=Anolis carolinensis TaxID=28377 RepID=G1KNI6_ANOCA|nr:PREDICTED: spermatogenesis-associated protein 7 isoform X1 [Anolis carolinensis]|eukprot:XP_008114518.1 PREDICTED: spermatogenesis-associated protein 7 isoform X1 [Anolis carolinensis]